MATEKKTQNNLQQKQSLSQLKYNSKAIHDRLGTMSSELSGLKAYFNKCEQTATKSGKAIIEINDEIKKHKYVSDHKATKLRIKNFAENIEEKQSNEKLVDFLKEKMKPWIALCETLLDQIRVRIRETDSKLQKKTLTQDDIKGVRKFLQEKIFDYQEHKQAIIENYANFQMESNCLLLESLTNKIQRQQ